MNGLISMGAVFDSFENVCLLSSITMLAAVILAFYFSNLVKGIGMDSIPEEREIVEQCSKAVLEKNDERGMNLANVEDQHDAGEGSETDNPLCDGLVSKLKSARIKELEAQLTRDQLEEERRIEREQLAAIFELLKKQETELNMREIDEAELAAQLNLYR